jgi:integrase/recombinase XerD
MLTIHRRHIQTCRHTSRRTRKCTCPIWIDWRINGRRIQRPIGTRDWNIAQLRAREMEADGVVKNVLPTTIEDACERFIADAKVRGLREASLYKYGLLFRHLQAFAASRGISFLAGLQTDQLRAFRESWPNKNLSARKKLELLKVFFRFCHDSEWIKTNPAKVLKAPRTENAAVLPFTESDMEKILAACETHPMPERRLQLRALVLLMRYSGLRIGDAVTLPRNLVNSGVLELTTQKSGTKVKIPLKPEVVEALNGLPVSDYFFWSGESKRRTVLNIWEQTFQSLFKRAGIHGHSHQFRHTFAISLLQKGTSLENVSKLLGHRSIKVTESHYAAWTEARQDELEKAVRKTW